MRQRAPGGDDSSAPCPCPLPARSHRKLHFKSRALLRAGDVAALAHPHASEERAALATLVKGVPGMVRLVERACAAQADSEDEIEISLELVGRWRRVLVVAAPYCCCSLYVARGYECASASAIVVERGCANWLWWLLLWSGGVPTLPLAESASCSGVDSNPSTNTHG